MYTEDRVSFREAKPLLERCGLFPVDCADVRIGIWDDMDNLVATGALVGDMLQMLAVDPACRGEDLAAKVVTALLREARMKGITGVYMITKRAEAPKFRDLGLRPVAEAGAAALLEWGSRGIDACCENFRTFRTEDRPVGCIVMNANPFTKGHRYLAEQAAAACGRLFILVVEEDRSEFPFADRLALVRQGTADLPNVTVLPGSRYVISALTFPAYFLRDAEKAKAESELDAALFVRYIAPALEITERFVGTEPLSASTNVYNETLERMLPPAGVALRKLPRLELGGAPVSASAVRALLREGRLEEACALVPATTEEYLRNMRK